MRLESLEMRQCLSAIGFAEHDQHQLAIASITADIDGDGDEDLVFGGEWRENVGSETPSGFGETHTYDHVNSDTVVSAGDLDGDGDLDLVTSHRNGREGSIGWFENRDGRGSFGPRQIIALDDGPYQPVQVLIDVDADGDLDVLRSYYQAGGYVFDTYRNDGARGFELQGSPQPGAQAYWPTDFDKDGDLDLITSNGWLANDNGLGHFKSIEPPVTGGVIFHGDLNSDGHADLLTSRDFLSISWYAGSATPFDFVFQQSLTVERWDGPSYVSAGDFDGDGDMDLAVTEVEHAGESVYDLVLHIQQDGLFERQAAPIGFRVNGNIQTFAVETNGDGADDLLYSLVDGLQIRRIEANGSVSEPMPIVDQRGSKVETLADIDGDGDLDAVTSRFSSRCSLKPTGPCYRGLYWSENLDGHFAPIHHQIHFEGGSFDVDPLYTVVAADVDGDGDNDLVYGWDEWRRGSRRWVENLDGKGTFSEERGINLSDEERGDATLVDAKDFDGDGLADLMLTTDAGVVWQRRNADAFADAEMLIEDVTKAFVHDFDRDGDLDIVSVEQEVLPQDRVHFRLVLFPNETSQDGAPVFGEKRSILDYVDSLDVFRVDSLFAFEDFDGDDDVDIMTPHRLFENNGQGEYVAKGIAKFAITNYADFDLDGDIDLLGFGGPGWAAPSCFINDGSNEFSLRPARAVNGVVGDVDGDGDPDLVASGSVWYETRPIGDANGDGVFNTSDLVTVMQAGLFDDDLPQNATFSTGDWNGDGEFDSADLVAAFATGTWQA